MHFGAGRHHSSLHLLLRTSHLTHLTRTSTSCNLDLHASQVALPGSHATVLDSTTVVVRCHELYRWDLGSNHHITSSWHGRLRDPSVTVHFMRRLKWRRLRKRMRQHDNMVKQESWVLGQKRRQPPLYLWDLGAGSRHSGHHL